ncbi:MAG TPA: type II toxin-antitoxin system RatA family toxin [Dongiaceae bacterium]|nr:type II toxin-antitoxin system RatA family toxin [Dongiaceae bacterium]
MKVHTERRILPFTPEQIFELVGDVARYPEFLPWCTGARIREKQVTPTGEAMVADLMIGFKMVREKFTSRVTLDRPNLRIDVEYINGPFKHLINHWTFSPTASGQCQIDFHLEFEFSSLVLQKLIGVLFHEAVRRMVAAFEARAHKLYQPIS